MWPTSSVTESSPLQVAGSDNMLGLSVIVSVPKLKAIEKNVNGVLTLH